MRKTAVLADSTCDLSEELIEKYGITIIPLHIILGEGEYRDGVDISPDEIYRWSDEHKTTPKTSAISAEDAEDAFRKAFAEAGEAVCFCISETMSASGNVMRVAADTMGLSEKVFVIDSQNLSTGIGLLVIEAALMADEGLSGSEIRDRIEELRPQVRASFVVDTLTYLYRGGRCGGLTAFAGSTLKLHPLIEVRDGNMHPGKKYRGKLEKAVMQYVNDLKPALAAARPDRVFVTHSGCDPELVGLVKKELEEMNYFTEILETRAGGVVSSHCGPGTLGVLFIA